MANGKDRDSGTLREHEKFWAFIILIGAVVGLAVLASQMGVPSEASPLAQIAYTGKLRIIDAVAGGLLTIAGMAAQALFRINQADRDLATAAKTTADTAAKLADKTPASPTATPSEPAVELSPGDAVRVSAEGQGEG